MKPLRFAPLLLVTFCVACGGGGTSSPAVPAAPATVPTAASTVAPAASPAPVATASAPAAFAATYALQAADVTAFANGVAAQCPAAPSAATRFDLDLLQADGSALVTAIPGKNIAQVQAMAANAVSYAVAASRLLPGIGFMLNPTYPTLVHIQANAPAWWSTAANYPLFAAYYAALAQGLSQNGIAFDAEANLVFPAYSGQNYSTVTLPQLEAGVAETAGNILSVIAPQYLNIASEPLTLSQNTGQPALNTPAGYAAYTAAVRSAIVRPPGSTTKIGAGSADWSSTAFLTGIESVPNLDFYDEHLYPAAVLTTAGGGIAQVDAIAPAVSGKPGVITENWDEKDAGNAAAYGAANPQALEQLNTYSFWAPLDAQYVTAMMRLARCQNLAVESFWYQNEFFAYLDYSSASALSATAAQNAEGQAGAAAASAGTLSAAGQALYQGLTGHAASGLFR